MAVAADFLSDLTGLRQGELGLQPGRGRPRKHFANAKVVSFERAGHWVHHDRLDDFMAETVAFIS